MQNKIAVVILNWNGKNLLQNFLPSVLDNNIPSSKIIVADNASTDDSIDFLQKNYPQIEIIQNKTNGGFAKGYNEALQNIKAEYYILLNSDVEVTGGWIEPVINMMDADKRIAACQPKILSYTNRSKFEHAGAAGGFIDKYGYPFCRGRIFNIVEEDKMQYDDIKEIFWASGACLFIRAEAFHNVKGFDEDFFAHMEEIDLCARIKAHGFKICYCPASVVYHLGGGSLNAENPKKTFLNFRNSLITLYKIHPAKGFLPDLLIRFIFDGIAGIHFLVEGKPGHFFAIIKAHFSFYRTYRKTKSKRRLLHKEVILSGQTGIYQRSIIIDFYLFGKKCFSSLKEKHFT